MKKKMMSLFILLSFFATAAQAEDLVLCSSVETVVVLAADLKTPLFNAQQYETVVPFQSFGEKYALPTSTELFQQYSAMALRINTIKELTTVPLKAPEYVRVEFIDREDEEAENNVGWIDQSLIKPKSKCAGYKESLDNDDKDDTPETLDLSGAGFSLSNCCTFPMKKKPQESFTEGMRRFGARRSRGSRAHAAADLYQSQYQPVYAITAGKVLRDRVSFYLGTVVTEIEHPGGFIARYGELAGARLKPLKLGSTVKAGQLIGFIKKVNTRSVKSAMLHFELYSGKASGPLTTKYGKYQRRSDLINPTRYLTEWEKSL